MAVNKNPRRRRKDADDEVRSAAEDVLFHRGEAGARAVAARLRDFSVWERRDAVELLGEIREGAILVRVARVIRSLTYHV